MATLTDTKGTWWTRPPRRILAILGPTATGKSSIALELAERVDAEIVNCDALQIYRRLDIGTAKPTAAERARVPHHLYDFVEPDQTYSAGRYARRAQEVLDEILGRRHAILVGGTGLYFRALTRGIAEIPEIPSEVRERIRGQLSRDGSAAVHARLAELDPVMADGLHPADSQRVARALEIYEGTGRSQREWIEEQTTPSLPGPVHGFALTLDRDLLYDRIRLRTQAMFRSGWEAEVRALLEQGVDPGAPGFQAIGYREIVDVVQGRATSAEALDRILIQTRRYAKRQMTWFRKEHGVHWLPADDPGRAVDTVLQSVS